MIFITTPSGTVMLVSLLETLRENPPPSPGWHRYILGLILRFNTGLKTFNRQAEWSVIGRVIFFNFSRLKQAGRAPLMD